MSCDEETGYTFFTLFILYLGIPKDECIWEFYRLQGTNFTQMFSFLGLNLDSKSQGSHIHFRNPHDTYREVSKGLYVHARNFFLLLLKCSAWPCLGPA